VITKPSALNVARTFIINICRFTCLNARARFEFLSSMHFGFFTIHRALFARCLYLGI